MNVLSLQISYRNLHQYNFAVASFTLATYRCSFLSRFSIHNRIWSRSLVHDTRRISSTVYRQNILQQTQRYVSALLGKFLTSFISAGYQKLRGSARYSTLCGTSFCAVVLPTCNILRSELDLRMYT